MMQQDQYLNKLLKDVEQFQKTLKEMSAAADLSIEQIQDPMKRELLKRRKQEALDGTLDIDKQELQNTKEKAPNAYQ